MENTQLSVQESVLLTSSEGQVDILSGDISHLILKRIVRKDPVEFTIDSQTFSFIRELDGANTIAAIAKSINTDIETLRKIVQRLLQIGVIAPTNDSGPVLKEGFSLKPGSSIQ